MENGGTQSIRLGLNPNPNQASGVMVCMMVGGEGFEPPAFWV